LNLHLNAGLIGSLPIDDNAIQLGSAVKYLFQFRYILCNPHAHLSIGVFAIAQFGFYCISPKMISILFIGYVYCCVYYLYSSKQTSLDLVIFAVYRQSHGDHRTYFLLFSSASVILVLIVVLGSLTTTSIASIEPPEIYFQPSCSSEHSHIIFSGTTISVYFMGL